MESLPFSWDRPFDNILGRQYREIINLSRDSFEFGKWPAEFALLQYPEDLTNRQTVSLNPASESQTTIITMTDTLHTSKSHHPQRWGPFTLAVLAFVSYLMIAAIRTYRGMDLLHKEDKHHHLRSVPDFFDQPQNSDKYVALRSIDPMDPVIWDERLFSPLIQSFFPELQDVDRKMWMEPAFKISEDGGFVKLTTSIPDIPLEDINIEVVGDRIIHIKGTKTTDSSRVSFDKRFSIGQKVDESKLEAKLTKEGVLEVSAPEVSVDEKKIVRKIPVTLAEEL